MTDSIVYTARLLNGVLVQDPSSIAGDFIERIKHQYVPDTHLPFLVLHFLHPDEERPILMTETLSPDVIYCIFFEYKTVLPWVDEKELDLSLMSTLPEAIRHLTLHADEIDYHLLSGNNGAGKLLWDKKDSPDLFNWELLSTNDCTEAISIIELYPERIDWNKLCSNLSIHKLSHLIKQNIDRINWTVLSANAGAIPILLEYEKNIDWVTLSTNPSAISLLEKNPEKINLHRLCENPSAIQLILERLDQFYPVDWMVISKHPSVHLILERLTEQDLKKLEWSLLSRNPSAFDFIQQHKSSIHLYSLSYNTHPDTIKLLEYFASSPVQRFTSPLYSIPGLLSNPSAIEFIHSQLEHLKRINQVDIDQYNYRMVSSIQSLGGEQWIKYGKATKTSIWKYITYNSSIYCPPL